MSPVFRHGRLRLYLLKLLDEAPRHGYEVIRLLQDRFLGVYAPSPGTIYPRLARLEEEGLVTHDEADGRKVYRITDKGREELHARLDDLAELEEEITASVRDIAREVSEDVRETVRSLREELTSAARDMQGKTQAGRGARAGRPGRAAWEGWSGEQGGVWAEADREAAGTQGYAGHPGDPADAGRAAGAGQAGAGGEPGAAGHDDRTGPGGQSGQGGHAGEGDRSRAGRGRGGRGWGDWPSWTGGPGWGDWSGWGGWPGAGGPHGQASHRALRDLERLARHFARELKMAAWHAQAVSEDALVDLRVILDETLDRIKSEVFADKAAPPQHGDAAAPSDAAPPSDAGPPHAGPPSDDKP
jgi:DNA-binding PadR family transcriptional regulator